MNYVIQLIGLTMTVIGFFITYILMYTLTSMIFEWLYKLEREIDSQ